MESNYSKLINTHWRCLKLNLLTLMGQLTSGIHEGYAQRYK